ncbi:hypothetical protein ACH5RR_030054 [Cinchona calisaya]|uniref:Bifunctional inhibitor/plant lipid transfer protein/seed storage helical domain-containing protein n=1 Tax=Cinchona calisaya TaxID=153742 RepID=A0ABD2YUQ0_9GENT
MKKVSNCFNIAIILMAMLASFSATISAATDQPEDPWAEARFCYKIIVIPCLEALTKGKPPSETCCGNLQKRWRSCFCPMHLVGGGSRYFVGANGTKVLDTCHAPEVLEKYCLLSHKNL